MNGDVEMGCTISCKKCGNKETPLAIQSRILAQSCVTVCLNIHNHMCIGTICIFLQNVEMLISYNTQSHILQEACVQQLYLYIK